MGNGSAETRAFEILVRENADMLTTYLRAVVRDSVAVDDLFQETMLTAWRKLDECDRTRPFGPWLRGIASRLVMAHHRKRKRDLLVCNDAVLEFLEQQVQYIGQRHGDTWDEKIVPLRECIDTLPEILREAIEFRYLRNERTREVACRLSLSMEALKKRLQRARSRLLDCLRRKKTIPEPGT